MNNFKIVFSVLIFYHCCTVGNPYRFFGNFRPTLSKSMREGSSENRIDLTSGEEQNIQHTVDNDNVKRNVFEIYAPPSHKIAAKCQLTTPYNDTKHVLLIERERTNDHSNAKAFYGFGEIEETSLFNYMRLQLKTDQGKFKCHVKAVPEENCECGWGRQARIVNGVEADANEFPSITSFIHRPSRFNFCGGTIVHHRCILTAAHCWVIPFYRVINDVEVVLGVHNITNLTQSRYYQSHRMARIIVHEHYYSAEQDNDIALVHLESDIIYTMGVGPACLPLHFAAAEENFYGQEIQMVGWGAIEYGGAFSKVLRKVTLTVMPTEECETKIIWVNSKKLCTFRENKDACQSDSGGPVYYTNKRQYIVGIISFGIRCATSAPGVNTRVTSYIDWIAENIKGSLCEK